MIVKENQPSGHAASKGTGGVRIAALDVEWQKNYRISNGNRAFCYSIIWIDAPDKLAMATFESIEFTYKSVYLEADEPAHIIVDAVNNDLRNLLGGSDVLVGHQLCSDLAVLRANAVEVPKAVAQAQNLWRSRRDRPLGDRLVIDTRFDLDEILVGKSRRLVDVCNELGLQVVQPELKGRSMTALHREWLGDGSVEARERVTVLNLRHSLSAALLAMHATGMLSWGKSANANRLLSRQLGDTLRWINNPIFASLLAGEVS